VKPHNYELGQYVLEALVENAPFYIESGGSCDCYEFEFCECNMTPVIVVWADDAAELLQDIVLEALSSSVLRDKPRDKDLQELIDEWPKRRNQERI